MSSAMFRWDRSRDGPGRTIVARRTMRLHPDKSGVVIHVDLTSHSYLSLGRKRTHGRMQPFRKSLSFSVMQRSPGASSSLLCLVAGAVRAVDRGGLWRPAIGTPRYRLQRDLS